MRKSLLLKYWILWIISLIWLSFFTTFWAWIFLQNVNNIYKLSNNIYLNSDLLNKTYLVYKSNYDISDAVFQSSCDTETKLMEKREDLYLFELKVTNKDCSNNIFFLKSKLWILNEIKLNLISDYKIYSILLDYWSNELNNILNSVDKKSSSLKIFTDYKNSILDDKYKFSKKKRTYEELSYKWDITKIILKKREIKYIIPVPWYNLPTKNASKLPNSWRPYRIWLTDWIHHSWDIDAPFGTKVVSLDDWVIIRIVKVWDKTDLANIRTWNNLSVEDKMRNLDIYRWNQVWIKTMKGELVMYAHLDKVVDSIKELTMVKSWDYLGNIWVTWVPEEWYDDYHLDFSVSENPYNLWKAWSYEIVDYMSWPWKFKWKSKDYIVNNQDNVFKK
jgi:hypothetical protein